MRQEALVSRSLKQRYSDAVFEVVARFAICHASRTDALRIAAAGALVLYPFRFVDPVTGKWTRARYVAELHEIAARHERWEITGGPEIRSRSVVMFSPSSKLAPRRAQVAIAGPRVECQMQDTRRR